MAVDQRGAVHGTGGGSVGIAIESRCRAHRRHRRAAGLCGHPAAGRPRWTPVQRVRPCAVAARPAHDDRGDRAQRDRAGAGQCRVLCAASGLDADRPARLRRPVPGRGAGRPGFDRARRPRRVRMEPAEAAATGGTGCSAGRGVDLPRHLLRAAPAAGHPARACTRAAPAAAGQCRGNPCRLERAAPMVAADHRAGGVQHRCCAGHRRHVAHAAPSPGQRITADPGNVPSDRESQRRRPAADRPGPGPAQPCRMDAGDGRVRDHPVATVAARWPTVDRGLRPAGGDGAVGRTPRVLPPGRTAR